MGYSHHIYYDPYDPAMPRLLLDAARIVEAAKELTYAELGRPDLGDGRLAFAGYDFATKEYRPDVPPVDEGGIKLMAWHDDPALRDEVQGETLVLLADPLCRRGPMPEEPAARRWVEIRRGDYDARGLLFEVCKTCRAPYDIVVATILLRAAAVVPGTRVGSDGRWRVEWTVGAQHDAPHRPKGRGARWFYAELFGEEPVCPWERDLVHG